MAKAPSNDCFDDPSNRCITARNLYLVSNYDVLKAGKDPEFHYIVWYPLTFDWLLIIITSSKGDQNIERGIAVYANLKTNHLTLRKYVIAKLQWMSTWSLPKVSNTMVLRLIRLFRLFRLFLLLIRTVWYLLGLLSNSKSCW